MKILFCSYRDWADNVLFELQLGLTRDFKFDHARSPAELTSAVGRTKYDVIVVVGWSWKVEKEIVDSNVVIGMHPSVLPAYAGGSPIQHQIIDGLKSSEATLFRLTSQLDGGDIVGSFPYSLEGHLTTVLNNLTEATYTVLLQFLVTWPNVQHRSQVVTATRKRLKPEHSHLSKQELATTSCDKLFNLIRCREDPYPNVFIEDETGRLVFKLVEFEPKVS